MIFFMLMPEAVKTRPPKQVHIDEGLFPRIGDGDSAALEELYCRTERTIYAFVLSLLKDPELTQDVVQETYLKIRSAAHLYEPQGKPLAWMFTIAKNLARNAMRRIGGDALEADLSDSIRYSYVSDPIDRMVLSAAMQILEETERQVILLHLVSGLRHREIAADLGMPLSTALSKYHRGLKKLQRYLLEKGAAE